MGLTEQLDELREARFQGRVKAVYEELVGTLDRAEVGQHTLAPGACMPGFLLPNAEGRLISSADLLDFGPLVVTFVRGNWCPFCMAMLTALEHALPEISSTGAKLLALTPETGGRASRAKQDHGLHCEILIDVDNAVAAQFGVLINPPQSYRALLADGGINLAELQGNQSGFIPIPATFVIGTDGIVRNAWIDLDVSRRVEPAEIIAALRRLAPSADTGH
jgi:peroxiredoxin